MQAKRKCFQACSRLSFPTLQTFWRPVQQSNGWFSKHFSFPCGKKINKCQLYENSLALFAEVPVGCFSNRKFENPWAGLAYCDVIIAVIYYDDLKTEGLFRVDPK